MTLIGKRVKRSVEDNQVVTALPDASPFTLPTWAPQILFMEPYNELEPYGPPLSDYPDIFLQRFPHKDSWTREDTKCFTMAKYETPEELPIISILERTLRYTQILQLIGCMPRPVERYRPLRYYLNLLYEYTIKHKIFGYYYGFLCLQPEVLERILGPVESDDCSEVIAITPAVMLERRYDERRLKRAVGYEKHPSGDVMFFRGLGGFYLEDAEALFDWIWSDRKAFMVLCRRIYMRGWSTLFYVLWARLRDSVRAETTCKGLRHLLMRYALVAPPQERSLACKIIHSIEDTFPVGGEEYKFVPVDPADAQNILDAFRKYLIPTREDPNIKTPHPLFDLLFYSALSIGREEVISLLDTILQHTWKLFEQNYRHDVVLKIKDAFYYGFRAIWLVEWALEDFGYATPDHKTLATTACIQVVNRPEFLELLGRLCSSLVMRFKNELIIPDCDAKKLLTSTEALMDALSRADFSYEFTAAPGMQQTWNRLCQFIDLKSEMIEGGVVRNRVLLCQRVWTKVGATFKFKVQRHGRNLCMNPRCPDPDPNEGARLLCERCRWVHYCSRRCQAL
ncbi:unnamed protein product [Rhizoctonia solani]|uniref:MYND-type domain-containing protein n=1 Tax=Rhizoctonia solani TaxID=456999 RepID=A0A8H3B9P5_9AGAM|nr:unnamed protein product [Rhizoctonia solani]